MHFLVYLTKYYSFSAETKQKKLYMCNPKILLTFTRQCMPKALGDQDKKKIRVLIVWRRKRPHEKLPEEKEMLVTRE